MRAIHLLLITLLIACSNQNTTLSEKEAESIGVEAYIYGYPLVTMEMARRQTTNVDESVDTFGAPMGQFYNLRAYPTAEFKSMTSPNADTLYSSAWLDVSKEPYILSLPDVDNRYFLMPLLSAWTEVFEVPGKRTTGTKAQTYAITGPKWNGTLPEGVIEYKSPTSLVWILGRIYCSGNPEDYAAVHAIQDKINLVPLYAYGKSYTPPKGYVDPNIDMITPTHEQVATMEAGVFFKLMASLLKDNPPSKDDASIVKKMAKIGLIPGNDFDINKLDTAVILGLKNAPNIALEKIEKSFETNGNQVNGWKINTKTGIYGTDYLNRALVTMVELGANKPHDAIYPTLKNDADGKPYNGAQKYVLHFDKGELPPVNGFWSLTMYNSEMFFVDNPFNRYTLSQRNEFKMNDDGSIDLYLQNESPGKDKEDNWLPAPKDNFVLMFRLYWPKEESPSILNGTWKPPAVLISK
ncbi:MAG TPA: DUF1254 domain-containing protein [Parachlamydiaceae bacterium]|nr:DUF1254 domain-containing protein [Parachlamydiaceae bacterium]